MHLDVLIRQLQTDRWNLVTQSRLIIVLATGGHNWYLIELNKHHHFKVVSFHRLQWQNDRVALLFTEYIEA